MFETCDLNWKIHLTAWIFGMFPLVIRIISNKIDLSHFSFMEGIDLETKAAKNCVTRWSDKAKDDFERINTAANEANKNDGFDKSASPAYTKANQEWYI